jgi:hypothetical protein
MVVLEAGARGCPVIAADRGGLIELVDEGEDGFLFAAGDPHGLAAALLRVAGDRSLSARLGRSRHARTVAHNTAAAHLPALLDTYERAARGAAALCTPVKSDRKNSTPNAVGLVWRLTSYCERVSHVRTSTAQACATAPSPSRSP